jgi:hypothetical protein
MLCTAPLSALKAVSNTHCNYEAHMVRICKARRLTVMSLDILGNDLAPSEATEQILVNHSRVPVIEGSNRVDVSLIN